MGSRRSVILLAIGLMLLCVSGHVGPIAAAPAPALTADWLAGWPMAGHDPQQTHRSASSGPRSLHRVFVYAGPCTTLIIGPDGSLYGWCAQGLLALSPTGQRRWLVPLGQGEGGPPVLAPNGLVLVNANSGRTSFVHQFVGAFRATTGQQRWHVDTVPWAALSSTPNSKGRAPLVTGTNLLYMPFVGPAPYHGVEVFGPGGQALGHVLPTIVPDVLAVAPNGVCYELGSGTLTAVSSQRTMLWQQPNYADAVLIGQQGTVYTAGGNRVDAYAPSGHLLWQRTMPDAITTLGERGDGTLLAVGVSGISAVRPTGQVVWHAPLGSAKAGASSSAPTLAIDAHGRAYIGGADGTVRAITPSGAVLWAQRAGGATPFGATPAVVLGPHGTLAIAGTDGQVAVYQ